MSQDQRQLRSPQHRQTDIFNESCSTLNSERSLYGSRLGSRSNSTINMVPPELMNQIKDLYRYVSNYTNHELKTKEIQSFKFQDHDNINAKDALSYVREQFYNYFQLFTRLNIEFKEILSIDLKLGTAEQIKMRQSEEIEKIGKGNKQLYSNNQINKMTYTQEMSTIQFQNFQLREKCKLQEEQVGDLTQILQAQTREHKQMQKQLAEAKQINAIQNNCINERKKEITALQAQIENLKKELQEKSRVVETVKEQIQIEFIQLNQQNDELKSEIVNITYLMQNMSQNLYQNFGVELNDDLVENVKEVILSQQNQILQYVDEIDQQHSDNYKRMKEKYSQQIKSQQATFEETINQYENQINNLNAQIRMLKNKTYEQEKIINQLNDNIDNMMNQQFQEDQQQNEQVVKQIQIESQNYLNQIKCKENEIENIKGELQYYKKMAENYQKQLNEEEENRNTLEQELIKQFKLKCQEIQEQYQKQLEYQNNKSQQQQKCIDELNQTIESQNKQIHQNIDTINTLEAREKLFNNRYLSAHEQMSVIEKQNKASATQAQEYKEQMLKLRLQNEKLELDLTFAIKEIENCKLQHKEYDEEISKLQNLIEELKQVLRDRNHNIDDLKRDIYNINVRKQWLLSKIKKPISNEKMITMIEALSLKYPEGIHQFHQDVNASFQDEEFILYKIVYNEEQLRLIAFDKGFPEFDQFLNFEKIGEIRALKSIYESTESTLYKGFMLKITQSFQNYRLMGLNFVMKVPKQESDIREVCINEILGSLFLNEFKKDKNKSIYNFPEQYAIQKKSQTTNEFFIITQIEQGQFNKLLHPLQQAQNDFTQIFCKYIYEKSKQQIVVNNLSCINNTLYDPIFSSEDGMISQVDQGIGGINQYLFPFYDESDGSRYSTASTQDDQQRRKSEYFK